MSKINGTVGRKPGGGKNLFKLGWDEEDVPSKINVNSVSKPKDPIIISKTPISIIKETETKKNTFEIETKLIDDILKPIGVNIKPNDSQLNEFIKRIKAFNKDVIGKILIDRIINLGIPTEDNNQVKQFMKALYVVECILQKKIEGYPALFIERSSMFITLENSFNNNKKICEIINNILILLGERKHTNLSSNQIFTNSKGINKSSNNNVDLFEEIVNNSSSKGETFSGLEIRNKNNNNQTTNEKPNGFNFIKGKSNKIAEEPSISNDKSNPELLNIFTGTNNIDVNNNQKSITKVEPTGKTGFNFIKTNKQINSNNDKDDLGSVFKNLNIVSKGGNLEKSENINSTLQEALNNKLDLDKLYSEISNSSQQNNHNINSVDYGNSQTTQTNYNYNNINIQSQNISYFQNFNFNIGDLSNNLKIGENYIPLDIKDYNKSQESVTNQEETKYEKDHFDFVNDLMKKKK